MFTFPICEDVLPYMEGERGTSRYGGGLFVVRTNVSSEGGSRRRLPRLSSIV